jgi:hypothetical protein
MAEARNGRFKPTVPAAPRNDEESENACQDETRPGAGARCLRSGDAGRERRAQSVAPRAARSVPRAQWRRVGAVHASRARLVRPRVAPQQPVTATALPRKSAISFRTALAFATVLALCATPALADSIDGNPMSRRGPQSPESVRRSPSIIFEDRGWVGPFDTCMTDDGYGQSRSPGSAF